MAILLAQNRNQFEYKYERRKKFMQIYISFASAETMGRRTEMEDLQVQIQDFAAFR